MLNSEVIRGYMETILKDGTIFLVGAEVRKGNHIRVLIDSVEGINIEDCANISRMLEAKLDRGREDFDLEVSSPGLGTPLRVHQQYVKNIGQQVDIINKNGTKFTGKLVKVTGDGIIVEFIGKALSGENLKTGITGNTAYFLFNDLKSTRVKVNF